MKSRSMSRPHTLLPSACIAVAALVLTASCSTDSDTVSNGAGDSAAGASEYANATMGGDNGTIPVSKSKILSADDHKADRPADQTAQPDISPKGQDSSAGSMLTVREIRTGDWRGKDRVVFEFDGQGTPGYAVAYTQNAAQQGSGRPVDLKGDAIMEVRMTGSALPMDTEATEVPVNGTVSGPENGVVTEVNFAGQFEGQSQAFIGMKSGGHAFTVFTLQNPPRLVIDIER